MKTQVDHGNSNTLLAAASERLGSDALKSPVAQAGANLASLDVAAADGLRGDVSLLGLDRLLELQLDIGSNRQSSPEFSEPSYPSFIDADLPAPLFHDDDLPAPSFHDDDLPAPLLHDHDFPADLTTVGLAQLLGDGVPQAGGNRCDPGPSPGGSSVVEQLQAAGEHRPVRQRRALEMRKGCG